MVLLTGDDRLVPDRRRFDVSFNWTLKHAAGATAGPNSVTYNLTVTNSVSGPMTVAPGACQAFTNGTATGHPWSGGTHPASQLTKFVGSCTLTYVSGSNGTATFQLTLSGIDYSKDAVPRSDSTGVALSPSMEAIASGRILIRITTPATSGNATVTASAPTYASANGQETATDIASNNTEGTAWTTGNWTNAWHPWYTNSTATYWVGEYKVSPGQKVLARTNILFPNMDSTTYRYAYQCLVLDTKYVTYDSYELATLTGLTVPGAVIWYYTGNGTSNNVNPSNVNYNPNTFNCLDHAPSAWTTTAPGNPAQVKAVMAVYPIGALVRANNVQLSVYQNVKTDIAASSLPQDVWEWNNFGWTTSDNSDWSINTWTRFPTAPRSTNPADMPASGTLVSSLSPPYNQARYPYSVAGRDLMWVIGASPTISKTASPTTIDPGQSTTFTIRYAAEGDATATPTRNGYTVVDTLPIGLTYVAGSSSAGEPTVSTSGGRDVLTWVFDNLPVNQTRTITFDALSANNLAPGTVLVNQVSASVDGETRTGSATVRVSQSGLTRLTKVSDQAYVPNPTGDGVGNASWTVTVSSADPVAQAFTDTIDILPYIGDPQGSTFAGSYTLSGPVDVPAGATVYYTTADPATLSTDAADPRNGAAGDVSGNTVGWTTTFTADATAVRVIGGVLAPSATLVFTIPFVTDGMDSGDVLVNVAESRAQHTRLLMRTSSQVSIATYYSASLKKYVLISSDADPDDPDSWADSNDIAGYPSYALGDDVRYRVVVTNTGAGTLTDIVVTDDLQPGLGAFTIDELAPGESESHEYTVSYGADDPSTIVNTACVTAASPVGDAPDGVQLSCDPAGVLIPNHPDVIVEKTSTPADGSMVAPGASIQYGVTFTNTGDAETLVDYTDHLVGVLDDAAIDVDSIAFSGDDISAIGFAWDADAQTIRVQGFVQPGAPVTLSYTVTVKRSTSATSHCSTW